jgi:hypothetical protein
MKPINKYEIIFIQYLIQSYEDNVELFTFILACLPARPTPGSAKLTTVSGGVLFSFPQKQCCCGPRELRPCLLNGALFLCVVEDQLPGEIVYRVE